MKMISQIFGWLGHLWHWILGRKTTSSSSPEADSYYQVENAEDVPEYISNHAIFVIQDGNEPELLAFKCPCGCEATILLNLLSDTKPQWHFKISDGIIITISPSIWRTVGCKSHFWVVEGNVKWV